MAVMDNAIKNGYTFAWGSDVSEQGFTRDGIAVMPDAARGAELTGSTWLVGQALPLPTSAKS